MADYCTLFPDGNYGVPCCKRHDRRYSNESISKREADILLRRCILRKAKIYIIKIKTVIVVYISPKMIANTAYIGVRVFGWYWYNKAQRKNKEKE